MDQFLEFSEDTIATILCAQAGTTDWNGRNFDVKINGLRFVGFVLELDQAESSETDCHETSNHIPINSFNISFILRTTASYSIVEMYFQLAAKICKSLRFFDLTIIM